MHLKMPHVVPIPEKDVFKRPREVYEKALADHGPVVAVKRKGRLEFIVDDTLTHEVLTRNDIFSFEEGTAYVLNLHIFAKFFKNFFLEIDELVRNVISSRMPLITELVSSVFMKHANKLLSDSLANFSAEKERLYVDALNYTHRSISEAMALVTLGPQFTHEKDLQVIEKVAHDMAVVTGIYQNTSWFGTNCPNIWRLLTWTKILFTTIPLYYATIGLQVWRKFQCTRYNARDAEENPELHRGSILDYLAHKHANAIDGKVGIFGFFHIMTLVLGIIFASVHQTASIAVWILYELAARPEYIPRIRNEIFEIAGVDWNSEATGLSYEDLQNATRLDSFVREVMRTKGDTLSTCRLTTRDTNIGGYTIPKGSLVIPLASLSHMSTKYHGTDAEVFNGKRWIGTGKQAVMINDTYFPFGLGRWACPGRVLAVAEIKMIVMSIICQARPVLKDGIYNVVDPLNVTSVAPKGEITLIPYTKCL
ncbi:hypothetical protein ACEPAH_3978 [Sanghuangporus vaninii]